MENRQEGNKLMALDYTDLQTIDEITNDIVNYCSFLNDKSKRAFLEILTTTIDEILNNKSTHA